MNEDKLKNQTENTNPQEDVSELSPEVLDKIKHPPSIDSTIREQSPEELKTNPAVSPEMLDNR